LFYWNILIALSHRYLITHWIAFSIHWLANWNPSLKLSKFHSVIINYSIIWLISYQKILFFVSDESLKKKKIKQLKFVNYLENLKTNKMKHFFGNRLFFNLSRAVFFSLSRFTEPLRHKKIFGGTPTWQKLISWGTLSNKQLQKDWKNNIWQHP